jgi:AcrR family transcriptional regulator
LALSRNAGRSAQTPLGGARERILRAAYALFSHDGINAVGIDTIIAHSGTAKMSLYRHFGSKEELVLAFLEQRRERWTSQWLEAEVLKRAADPATRLLAIFDVFDAWFQEPDFEGCSFINVLLEAERGGSVHRAAADHLAEIRVILARLAREAGLEDVERFAHTWHFLMKGSIISAYEGYRDAARDAKRAGELILQGWPRRLAS